MKRKEDSLRVLWNNIKYTKIHFIGIQEGEEREREKAWEIFEEIIAKSFLNIGRGNAAQKSHTGQTQGGTCWDTYESKWQKLKTEKIWKATKEKQQITYEGILIRLSADFSAETLQARREWHNIFQMMKGKSYNQE